MKKMQVKDDSGRVLFIGSKQDCMHWIKVRRYDRANIHIEEFEVVTPELHTTAPIEPKPKGFFKRIFS